MRAIFRFFMIVNLIWLSKTEFIHAGEGVDVCSYFSFQSMNELAVLLNQLNVAPSVRSHFQTMRGSLYLSSLSNDEKRESIYQFALSLLDWSNQLPPSVFEQTLRQVEAGVPISTAVKWGMEHDSTLKEKDREKMTPILRQIGLSVYSIYNFFETNPNCP